MIISALTKIIEKNKDRARENRIRRQEKEAESLGFSSSKDYESFKQKIENETKKKVEKTKRDKKRKEIQSRITYDLTHSKLEKFGDSIKNTQKTLKKMNSDLKMNMEKLPDFKNEFKIKDTSYSLSTKKKPTKKKIKKKSKSKKRTTKKKKQSIWDI